MTHIKNLLDMYSVIKGQSRNLSKFPVSFLSELSLSHFKEPFAVHEETKATSSNRNNYNQGEQRQVDFDFSQWKLFLKHED